MMQGEIAKDDVVQSTMFETPVNDTYLKLAEELKAVDMNSISPMQAFSILADLVSRVK